MSRKIWSQFTDEECCVSHVSQTARKLAEPSKVAHVSPRVRQNTVSLPTPWCFGNSSDTQVTHVGRYVRAQCSGWKWQVDTAQLRTLKWLYTLYINIRFLPQRKHNKSPLQRQTDLLYLWKTPQRTVDTVLAVKKWSFPLLTIKLGTRCRWVVSFTLRPVWRFRRWKKALTHTTYRRADRADSHFTD